MKIYDIIFKKRNGEELTKEEIDFFVNGYTDGSIADYQASAFIMAAFINGLNDRETTDLTLSVANSGDKIDLSFFGDLTVDKHSTGGVGDKTTLIVAPIVASCGCKVAKMSGRGLGHTGGTVDKLESIPGYKTSLEIDEFLKQVEDIGIAVIGQTGNLAPADKKIYALRDVTATVDNIPLIVSSIMSKKIAAGSKNIVLDVKVGSGAFMKTIDDAEKLANKMVDIGKSCGRNTAALLTNMDIPLGKAIGNALEVAEAIEVLKGNVKDDLYEVCVELSTVMISLVKNVCINDAKVMVEESISSGAALNKMREWVSYQGGNLDFIDNASNYIIAESIVPVYADCDGYISKMNAEKIGMVSLMLGGGRIKKDDNIDHSAGVLLNKKTGEYVKKGDLLCTFYSNKPIEIIDAAKSDYLSSINFSNIKPEISPVVHKIIY